MFEEDDDDMILGDELEEDEIDIEDEGSLGDGLEIIGGFLRGMLKGW